MVGDPSGKQKMRPMMERDVIERNARGLTAQLVRIVGGAPGGPPPVVLDNAEWLSGLSYIGFLRSFGRHMSVNRMLARESARRRFESEEGLSFLEFNYACLQAFDFLHLYREHGCRLQMGGQDQWGNICEGIDLISRPELGQGRAFGMTFPLLIGASGEKFGKTAEGAVWLDPDLTPPFDYYQFWRNCDDDDVLRNLLLFTELEERTVREGWSGNVNRAKEILAYECTKLVHGAGAAAEAFGTAVAQFRAADPEGELTLGSDVPPAGAREEDSIPTQVVGAGAAVLRVVDLLAEAHLTRSKGEARRLIEQGGVYVDGERVGDPQQEIPENKRLAGRTLLIALGKKRRRKIRFE
jgi:tyrosyl-tRNA synthetase